MEEYVHYFEGMDKNIGIFKVLILMYYRDQQINKTYTHIYIYTYIYMYIYIHIYMYIYIYI
jgi:hypothetical protein